MSFNSYEANLNFINTLINNTIFNREPNPSKEINLHEFSTHAKSFRVYEKFLDKDNLELEKLKEIKAFINSVDKLEPIRRGLICWLDGRDGNNTDRTSVWKDRSGNGNDITLSNFIFDGVEDGWKDGSLFINYDNVVAKKIAKSPVFLNLDSRNSTIEIRCSVDKESDIDEFVVSLNKNGNTTTNDAVGFFKWRGNFFSAHSRDNNTTWFPSGTSTNKIKVGEVYTHVSTHRVDRLEYSMNDKVIFTALNSDIRRITDPTILLFSQTELNNTNLSEQSFAKHVSIYGVRIYNVALTPEEIRHNYLYDLYVQYCIKNQINSNTVETYYDFDPEYDQPHPSIDSFLQVVNGRLAYYNPSGSAPLRIANNKTLEECIVEETDDYIIYSDGDKTEENPIPEGIYFACRVDKHTGEIYYGEGYENLARNMYSNFTSNLAKVDVNSTSMEVRLLWTARNKYDSISFPGLRLNLPTTINIGDVFNCYYETRYGTTPNRGLNINYKDETDGWLTLITTNKDENLVIPADFSSLIDFCLVRFQSFNFTSGIVSILSKILLTKNKLKNKTPFVKSKCPYGQLSMQTNSSKNNSSFVITGTNYGRHENMVFFNYCDVNFRNIGSLETKHYFIDVDSIDVVMSKLYNKAFFSNGTENSTFSNGTGWEQENAIKYIKLSRETSTNNKTFNTISCRRFSIYKGELSEDALKLERNKNIKLKKFYRVSGNQTNFLGIEDIFTSNNTKEILDGTVIDTTKTPIEYKEQKDISKTSNLSTYTKINVDVSKSKYGFIKDIKNTNDFKNLPDNLAETEEKYDDIYQSPTVNKVNVTSAGAYVFRVGAYGTTIENIEIINNKNYSKINIKDYGSLNQVTAIFKCLTNANEVGSVESISLKIRSDAIDNSVTLFAHQIRHIDGLSDTQVTAICDSSLSTNNWTSIKIQNVILNKPNQDIGLYIYPQGRATYVEVKDIQIEFSDKATPYVPPNSDGNFIPTYSNNGIYSIEQTTKDTDKNENTFARLMYLP